MRKLSVKQKKLLKTEYKNLIENGVFAPTCDDIPYHVSRRIFELNMFEIFDSEVDRYFTDLYLEHVTKKGWQ